MLVNRLVLKRCSELIAYGQKKRLFLEGTPHNNPLQRRPRSVVLINIGVPHAAPLNAGVRPLYVT